MNLSKLGRSVSQILMTTLVVFFMISATSINSSGATSGIDIYFEKPTSWDEAWIWYDEDSDGEWETTTLQTSPGDMEYYRTANGYDWYQKSFEDANSVTFLFNPGDWDSQVDDNGSDFYTTADIWVRADGTTSSTDPISSETLTVHFKNTDSWSSPYCYAWTTDNDTVTELLESWPGTAMTEDSFEGDDWYTITISSVSECNLIFSDNGSNQTDDLTRSGEGWYMDGTWYASNPEEDQPPTITVSPAGSTFTDTQTITITISSTLSVLESYYILDGLQITITDNSAEITIGSDMSTGDSVTLTVYASNDAGSTETPEYTYTKTKIQETTFSWDNATIYFVMTDRFYNADSSNDNSYGRKSDYSQYNDTIVGTFHGGDIAGLTAKLDYLDDLGVNAVWMTGPFEQAHGWVGGADDGNFPHYAYHGYYTLDHTMIDKNMGTVEEMRTFVTEAHNRGIRVMLDVVLNHPGYATLLDMYDYGFGGLSVESRSELEDLEYSDGTWHNYHDDYVDYDSTSAWTGYWGSDWIRAGLPGYTEGGSDDLTQCLANLPDFITESYNTVDMAQILQTKWDQEGSEYEAWQIPAAEDLRDGYSNNPTGYVISWLAAWVEEFGIDGFRCDTVKHVEAARWQELDDACETALQNWRNSSRSDGDPAKEWTDNFWMTGEYYGYGLDTSGGAGGYYDSGFDNMIDFSYGVPELSGLESQFNNYLDVCSLPYISSHDTSLYWNEDVDRQNWAGTALLLNTSPVQIFYGDEIGRDSGENEGDETQGTRSAFEWDKVDNEVNLHWKKIGTFRKDHVSIGAGSHNQISSSPYTFSRISDNDQVVICLGGGSDTVSVNVSSVFSDGTTVRNAYDDSTATVSDGYATFSGDIILIEEAN